MADDKLGSVVGHVNLPDNTNSTSSQLATGLGTVVGHVNLPADPQNTPAPQPQQTTSTPQDKPLDPTSNHLPIFQPETLSAPVQGPDTPTKTTPVVSVPKTDTFWDNVKSTMSSAWNYAFEGDKPDESNPLGTLFDSPIDKSNPNIAAKTNLAAGYQSQAHKKTVESLDKTNTGSGAGPNPLDVVGFTTNILSSDHSTIPASSDVMHNLAQLGMGFVPELDNNGKPTGQQVIGRIGSPTLTQGQISTIINSTAKAVNQQKSDIQEQINAIQKRFAAAQASDIATRLTSGKHTQEVTPSITMDDTSKKELEVKRNELLNLDKEYQGVVALYGSIGKSLNYMATKDPASTVMVSALNATPKGASPDWKAIGLSLKDATDHFNSWSYNKAETIEQGNNSLYIDDPITALGANYASQHPDGGIFAKPLTKRTIDKAEYQGIYENYTSMRQTISTDQKILDQMRSAVKTTLADAATKNYPVDRVNAQLKDSGLLDAIDQMSAYIGSKNKVVAGLKQQITSGSLSGLEKMQAEQLYVNDYYSKHPILSSLNSGTNELLDQPGKFLTFISSALPKTFGNFLANLAPEEGLDIGTKSTPEQDAGYYFKQRLQQSPRGLTPFEERTLDDGTVVQVPVYQKGINAFDDKGNFQPSKINWDVLAYHATSLGANLLPLMAGGEAFEGADFLKGLSETASRGKGFAEIGEAAGVDGATASKYAYQALGLTAKAGNKLLTTSLGYVLPGMITFSPASIQQEMQNKSLTQDQAVGLGYLRGAFEAWAYSINPLEMAGVSRRVFSGAVGNAALDGAYETFLKTNWPKWTGSSLSDIGYKMLFNSQYVVKGLAEAETNMVFQSNLALAGNALITKVAASEIPGYMNKEYELTGENIKNTTITAMATALPFGITHIYGQYKNSEFARTNALFQVARNPVYFYDHIESMVDPNLQPETITYDEKGVPRGGEPVEMVTTAGKITKNEGDRQKSMVQAAADAYQGLSAEFDKIDAQAGLSDEEKHSLQFDLFKNKIDQTGLVGELTKDLTDDRRAEVVEKLRQNTENAEAIMDKVRWREKATPDQRMRADAEDTFSQYVKDNLAPELRERYDVKDYESRLEELQTLAETTKNPYLAASYISAKDNIQLGLDAAKYRQDNSSTHLDSHVGDLVDWMHDESRRADESIDLMHRQGHLTSYGYGHPSEAGDLKQAIIEGNMNERQRFLYNNHKDLINAEFMRRSGMSEPTPGPEKLVETPEEGRIQPEEPQVPVAPTPEDIQPEDKPTLESIQNTKEVSLDELNPDAKEIGGWLTPMTINQAIENVESGKISRTSGLPKVYVDENGKHTIADGFHRIAKQILDGKDKFLVEVVPAPVETPIPVINERAAKQTEAYIRIQDDEAAVQQANTSSLNQVFKLAGIDINDQDGIKTQYDPLAEGAVLIVEVPTMAAYAGREANEVTGVDGKTRWVKQNDELNPNYIKLQSPKFFQKGTIFTISAKPAGTGEFEEKAKERFKNNSYDLISGYEMPADEVNKIMEDPVSFRHFTMEHPDGSPDVHAMDYLRGNRVAGWVETKNGPVNNMKAQVQATYELRKKLAKAIDAGQKVEAEIVGVSFGFPIEGADGKSINVKDAFKDSDVLSPKNCKIVTNPKEFRYNGVQVSNFKGLTIGRPAAAFPTPVRGQFLGLHMTRSKMTVEEVDSIINALRLWIDYETALSTGDRAKADNLKSISDRFAAQSDDPGRYGIHTFGGVQWYINQLVYAGESTSKYTSPGSLRTEMKDIPFIDIDPNSKTITYSYQRLLDHLEEDEPIRSKADENGFEALKKAGIFRQAFITKGQANPHNEYFFRRFQKFLLGRPKDFKEEKRVSITKPFKIPLLSKIEDTYSVLDTPKFAKNSGISYHDYMLNNLYTTNRMYSHVHEDGTKENFFFEQSGKMVQYNFPPEKNENPEEDNLTRLMDWYSQMKKASSWTDALALLKDAPPHAGIQASVDAVMAKLKANRTYAEKKAEFEDNWKNHNELVSKMRDFNDSRKDSRMSIKGIEKREAIATEARAMGFTVSADNSGRLSIRKEGSKANISKKSFPEEAMPVTGGKITYKGESVGKEDAEPFNLGHKFDTYTEHANFELSNGQLKSGFEALKDNKLDNLAAQAILKKVAEWKSTGSVEFVKGTGANIVRTEIPFKDVAEATKDLIEAESKPLTEEETEALQKEYDENTTPEQQEADYEQYQDIDENTEGEVNANQESDGEIPGEEGTTEEGGDEKNGLKSLDSINKDVSLSAETFFNQKRGFEPRIKTATDKDNDPFPCPPE